MSVERKSGSGAPPEDGFLGRWSRRKEQARQGQLEEEAPSVEDAPEADASPKDDDLSDAELLEKYELPDPDGMAAGDDFSAFMRDEVPARLRTRALRKLWLTNSTLANLDELLDYGEDFTDAATVVENLQTAYQVGRGFAPPEKEDEDESEIEAAEAGDDDAPDELERDEKSSEESFDQSADVPRSEGERSSEEVRTAPQSTLDLASVEPAETVTTQRRARRMAFKFD